MVSTVAFAEETTETCANGAGTVITGAITGHKYCKSNNAMNWWNAVAWCDALGRQLFPLNNCECDNTTANCNLNGTRVCPELTNVSGSIVIWSATPVNKENAYKVNLFSGSVTVQHPGWAYGNNSAPSGSALCK